MLVDQIKTPLQLDDVFRLALGAYTGSSTRPSANALASSVALFGTPFFRPGPPRFSPEVLRATAFVDLFIRGHRVGSTSVVLGRASSPSAAGGRRLLSGVV